MWQRIRKWLRRQYRRWLSYNERYAREERVGQHFYGPGGTVI